MAIFFKVNEELREEINELRKKPRNAETSHLLSDN